MQNGQSRVKSPARKLRRIKKKAKKLGQREEKKNVMHTERGVLAFETEISEGRGVGEALEDAVEIARVAEVLEPYRGAVLALLTE